MVVFLVRFYVCENLVLPLLVRFFVRENLVLPLLVVHYYFTLGKVRTNLGNLSVKGDLNFEWGGSENLISGFDLGFYI